MSSPAIKKEALLEQVLEKNVFYVPKHETSPIYKSPKAKVKIASIVSDLVFDLFRFDAEMDIILESEYEGKPEDSDADFFLVDSNFFTATKDWDFKQTKGSDAYKKLLYVIKKFKERKIPTVFWITSDKIYYPHFVEISKHFDHVYYADKGAKKYLEKRAKYLPPAVQTALFHPYTTFKESRERTMNILFDGWNDICTGGYTPYSDLIDNLDPQELSVVDSENRLWQGVRGRMPKHIKDTAKGCVHSESLPDVLRASKIYLSFTESLRSPMLQTWKMLQAAACRVPIVHVGELDEDDFRKELVEECDNYWQALAKITRIKEDFLYGETISHILWREVFEKHSSTERLNTILEDLKIETKKEEEPLVTLVAPTANPHFIDFLIEQYECQTYSNKELVIVANSKKIEDWDEISKRFDDRDDVIFTFVPKDCFAGTAMNIGKSIGNGEYVFRITDDDWYGPEYLTDIMLSRKSVDAAIMGKKFTFFKFDEEQEIYLRKKFKTKPMVFYAKDLHYERVGLAGSTIGGKASQFSDMPYPNDQAGSADAELSLVLRETKQDVVCLCVDQLNFLVGRSEDGARHTWPLRKGGLLNNSVLATTSIDELLV